MRAVMEQGTPPVHLLPFADVRLFEGWLRASQDPARVVLLSDTLVESQLQALIERIRTHPVSGAARIVIFAATVTPRLQEFAKANGVTTEEKPIVPNYYRETVRRLLQIPSIGSHATAR